jgi:hypothetical protein
VAVPVRIGDTRLLTIPFSANGPLAALRALYGSEKAEKRMREITRDPALWAKRWEVIQKDAQAAGYGGFELKGGPAWAAKNVVIFAAKDAVPIKPAAAMNGEVEKAVRLNGTPFFPLLLSKALRVKAEHGGGEVVGIDHLSHDAGSGMGHYAVHVRDKDGNVTTKHWLLHHSVVQRAVQHRSNTGGVRVKRVYQSAYRAPQRAKNSPGGQIPAAGAKNAAAGASAPVAAKVAAAPGARNGSAAGTAPGKAPEGAKPAQTPRTIPQPAAGANPTAAQGQAPQPLQTRFFGMKRQGAQLHLQHSPVGFAGKQLHESPLTKITHQGDVAGSEDAIYHGHAASGKVYAFRAKKADMAQWGNYMDEESRLHHQEVAGGAKQAGAKPPVVRKEPLIR